MYFSPGFGSLIIQILVAGIAAGGAVLVMARKRIAAWFGRAKKRDGNDADHAEE